MAVCMSGVFLVSVLVSYQKPCCHGLAHKEGERYSLKKKPLKSKQGIPEVQLSCVLFCWFLFMFFFFV